MENKVGKTVYSVIVLILLIAAFVLGYYTFAFWHQKHNNTSRQPVSLSETLALNATPLQGESLPVTRRYIGYIRPIHEAQIRPFINGFIEKITVNGGEFVRKGDLLIVLQQGQYQAELAAAYADVLKSEANLKNAQVYYNRIQKAGSKAVSPTDLDNAQAQFLAAQASFEQARANYALAGVNFEYTIIKAPISGIVGDVSLTKGNYVSPASEPLISIMQYSPIRVVFSVTDKEYLQELNKPKPFAGEEIYLQLPSGEIFPNRGVFKYTDNTINQTTNSIAVYADFDNIGKTLAPNAYVTVLIKKVFANAIALNKDVVSLEEDGNYIFIISNGKLLKAKIDILTSEPTQFIVKNTFQKGDYLVLEKVKSSDLNKSAQPKLLDNSTNSSSHKAEKK